MSNSSIFDRLPLELYLKIFQHLSVKTILNLRLVNKHFMNLIDEIDTIWHNAYIKLDMDDKTRSIKSRFDLVESILTKVPNIEIIEIKCSHALTDEEKTVLDRRCAEKGGLLDGSLLYSIRFGKLNSQSIIPCLKIVTNCCSKLTIDSFYEPNGGLKPHQNFDPPLIFPHLSVLDLNCIITNDSRSCFQQQNDLIKHVILDRFDELFPNLTHLHLRLFIYSGYQLKEKLAKMKRLKFLELHNCWMNGSNEISIELDKLDKTTEEAVEKLKIDTYLFRSSRFAGIRMFLDHFTDFECLTTLSLFNVSLGVHEFECLLCLVAYRLRSLISLATDLFQTYALNDIFDARIYGLVDLIFSRLDHLALCDCNSFFDNTDRMNKPKRNRYSNKYNYRFDLNDFWRLFNYGTNGTKLPLKSLLITFVGDCCAFDERKLQNIVQTLIGFFNFRAECLSSLEIKFNCESFVFNNCDFDTCKFNDILKSFIRSDYFKSFKVSKNSIKCSF